MRAGLLLAALLLVTACSREAGSAAPEVATAPTALEQGELLVLANCSGCHAVDTDGDSPHSEAPAFRTLSKRYPVAQIEEALVEGIVVGHPDMPEFRLTAEDARLVVDYLESIQTVPAAD